MKKLPVVIGYGGISSAGISSHSFAFNRYTYASQSKHKQQEVVQSLQSLTSQTLMSENLLTQTLIRPIQNLGIGHKKELETKINTVESNTEFEFYINPQKIDISKHLDWKIKEKIAEDKWLMQSKILEIKSHSTELSPIPSAGQLPSYLDFSSFYNNRNHPRSVCMSIFGINDCLNSSGLDWQTLSNQLDIDDVAVYSTSSLGQLDNMSIRGIMQANHSNHRINAKFLPMSYPQSPGDFVSAYVLNSLGSGGGRVGACATFLYNLELAYKDIINGDKKIVFVGSANAEIVPEILMGFNNMTALINYAGIEKIEKQIGKKISLREISRPFGINSGFVMSESSQYIMLASDDVVMELGANVYGSILSSYSNMDGIKKSISSPGIGNYLTFNKSVNDIVNLLGKEGLNHTFFHAHGTSTPMNRVTESKIMDNAVKLYVSKQKVPVCAIKSLLGHSQGCAGGDQIMMALSSWQQNMLPGIQTVENIADDVEQENLDFVLQDRKISNSHQYSSCIVNSKGFGGNNASSTLLSPQQTIKMLEKRHKNLKAYQHKNEQIQSNSLDYKNQILSNQLKLTYNYGQPVYEDKDIQLDENSILIDKNKRLSYKNKDLFNDMI